MHAKLLALSAPNTRPSARPEAGQRELSGGGNCLSWLDAEGGVPGITLSAVPGVDVAALAAI